MKLTRILLINTVIICTTFVNSFGQNLKKHKWNNRILIVKTLNQESKKYQDQIKEFNNSYKELTARKFIIYKITGKNFIMKDYTNDTLNISGVITKKLTDKVLNEKEDFEVILIGLDGRVKLRQTEIVLKEDLNKIVDAMPMRRSELRKKL